MNNGSRKQAFVWAGFLIFLGIFSLLQNVNGFSDWVWVVVLTLGGLAFVAVYLTDRSELALLIPAYILFGIAGLIAFTALEVLSDAFVPTYVLSVIALPFLIAYVRDREQKGFLIPAYVLLAIGVMIAFITTGILDGRYVPAYVMFAVALPFAFVFVTDNSQRWALIPASILAIVGLGFLFAFDAIQYVMPVLLILAGLILVLILVFRRESSSSSSSDADNVVEK